MRNMGGSKMRPFPKPFDIVLEVGAGFGNDTFNDLKAMKGKGKLILIEPRTRAVNTLREKVSKSKYKENLIIVQSGVGDYNGKGRYQSSTVNFRTGGIAFHTDQLKQNLLPSQEQEIVVVQTLDKILDDLKIGEVDFINIDVEGAGPAVLRGLSRKHIKKGTVFYIDIHWNLEEIKKELERLNVKITNEVNWGIPHKHIGEIYGETK